MDENSDDEDDMAEFVMPAGALDAMAVVVPPLQAAHDPDEQ